MKYPVDHTVPDDWHRLFSAALDNRLNAAEQEQLATLLRSNAAARRLWFLYHDNECSLAERRPTVSFPAAKPVAAAIFRRRQWMTAAACFIFGSLCASAVFAHFLPPTGTVTTLLQASFETGPAPAVNGMPRTADIWAGDFSAISSALDGITPADGERMLQFLRGDHEGLSKPLSHSSDVLHLVDVRPYRKEFADGNAVVQLTTLFNAVPTAPSDPTYCALTIFALDAELAGSPDLVLSRDSLAYSRSSRVWLDGDRSTWQLASNELRVPPETEYLMIRVGVSYDVKQHPQHPENFAGHFADNLRMVLAHRPGIKAP